MILRRTAAALVLAAGAWPGAAGAVMLPTLDEARTPPPAPGTAAEPSPLFTISLTGKWTGARDVGAAPGTPLKESKDNLTVTAERDWTVGDPWVFHLEGSAGVKDDQAKGGKWSSSLAAGAKFGWDSEKSWIAPYVAYGAQSGHDGRRFARRNYTDRTAKLGTDFTWRCPEDRCKSVVLEIEPAITDSNDPSRDSVLYPATLTVNAFKVGGVPVKLQGVYQETRYDHVIAPMTRRISERDAQAYVGVKLLELVQRFAPTVDAPLLGAIGVGGQWERKRSNAADPDASFNRWRVVVTVKFKGGFRPAA